MKDVLKVGYVLRRTKGFVFLRDEDGLRVECKIKGSLFEKSQYNNRLAVGDQVLFKPEASGEIGLVHEIVKRKSFLSRSRIGIEAEQVIAANVDYLLITQSAKSPRPRSNFIFRMLTAAEIGNVTPVLVITKMDLVDQAEMEEFLIPFKALGVKIITTSDKNAEDEKAIEDLLHGHISVLSGPSGVGKSSLINRIYPDLNLKVGEVIKKTNKGAHTTTNSCMYEVTKDTFIVDTPGIRELGLWAITQQTLYQFFPGLSEYAGTCKHKDCRHLSEPGCTAKAALEAGEILPEIFEAYHDILDSLVVRARQNFDK